MSLAQVSKVDLGNQGRNFNFSNASSTRPVKTGTALPATCGVGDLFYRTDAIPGANLYGCTATNTWTLQSSQGGGGGISTVGSSDGSVLPALVGTSLDLTVNPAVVATVTSNNDLTGTNKVGLGGNGFVSITVPNEGATGTIVNRLVTLTGNPSSAKLAATGTASGIIGIVVSGAGTAGNARIAVRGFATCDFDGATTAGDYLQVSSSTAGKCADAGGARPSSGQILGYVTTTNGSAGSYRVLLVPDVQGGSGGSSGGTVTHSAGNLTSGQLIAGNGGGDIKPTDLAGDVTTAGSTATTVAKIQGRGVASTAPADQQVLQWSAANNQWQPGTVSGSTGSFQTPYFPFGYSVDPGSGGWTFGGANYQYVWAFDVPKAITVTKFHMAGIYNTDSGKSVAAAIVSSDGNTIIGTCRFSVVSYPDPCTLASPVTLSPSNKYWFVLTSDSTVFKIADIGNSWDYQLAFNSYNNTFIGKAASNSTGSGATLAVAVPLGAITSSSSTKPYPAVMFRVD